MVLLGVAIVVAWCCYGGCQVVAVVLLGGCYVVAMCCYGFARFC